MPLLLKASQMAIAYGQGNQTFAIIDHEGIFRLKTKSLMPVGELRDEVLLALADLPPPRGGSGGNGGNGGGNV